MDEQDKPRFGRVVKGKDGKVIGHLAINPHEEAAHDPAKIEAAHGYVRGKGKAFQALKPEEIRARTVKPKAKPAPAAPIKPEVK